MPKGIYKRKPFSEERKESIRIKIDIPRAIKLHKSGLTLKEIAEELGVGYRVIFNNFKRVGYERPRKAWNKGKEYPRMRGENNPAKRPEVRKKISDGLKGTHTEPKSQEFKEKVSLAQRGSKCHAWKGGITPMKRLLRKCFKYRQWRSDVFTRDDFACQICGDKKGGNLEAHHIKSLSTILEEYKILTLEEALNCEEMWNINNGLTFCQKCHIEFHRNEYNKKK